jgi:Isoprenylcysteine carboxyl methyltransferase (ICMT) family/Sigma-70 region 2
MTQAASGSVDRQIESVFGGGSVAGLSDRQLIDRFNARRDAAGEAALAAMVHRHGPMVLDICRQLLGDPHHAEDAFQAVFLVLARKAGVIRDPDLLGTWLYGVTVGTRREHTMVTHGPYRWVRHPFYSVAFLGLLAFTLMTASWFLARTDVVVIALLVYRSRAEEAKLIERFGDEYRAHRERTGAFFPRWTR